MVKVCDELGTRPEAIELAPVIGALRNRPGAQMGTMIQVAHVKAGLRSGDRDPLCTTEEANRILISHLHLFLLGGSAVEGTP